MSNVDLTFFVIVINQLVQVLHVYAGWPAAVIADTPEHETDPTIFRRVFLQPVGHFPGGFSQRGVVPFQAAMAGHSRTVEANPCKIFRR